MNRFYTVNADQAQVLWERFDWCQDRVSWEQIGLEKGQNIPGMPLGEMPWLRNAYTGMVHVGHLNCLSAIGCAVVLSARDIDAVQVSIVAYNVEGSKIALPAVANRWCMDWLQTESVGRKITGVIDLRN